jgi:hypothetical protein
VTDNTANLDMPYILPSQAQKHVTHNEALRIADALIQLCIASRSAATPPAVPQAGARYLVADSAGGIWAGHDGEVAAFADGSWSFHQPKPGWRAWIADEGALVLYNGSAWQVLAGAGVEFDDLARLGVNTSADATNRLAVKSDAALLSHDDITPGSGDMRLAINKAATGNTASMVFQTGFSGRAEMGTAGDDNFHLKVSSDGTAWSEVLGVDASNAALTVPSAAYFAGAFGIGRPGIAPGGIYFNRNPDNPFLLFSAGDPAAPANIGQFRAQLSGNLIGITGPSGSPYLVACQTASQRVGIKTATPSNVLSVEGIAAPETDNAYSCGTAAKRWSTIYAATGTINTSDQRDKLVSGRPAGAAARIVDRVEPVLFRWTEGGRERTGAGLVDAASAPEIAGGEERSHPGKRLHAGWLAQQVKAAFDAEGIDCAAWGLDNPADPESRQWLRPDELTALLWEAVRQTRAELNALREGMDAA